MSSSYRIEEIAFQIQFILLLFRKFLTNNCSHGHTKNIRELSSLTSLITEVLYKMISKLFIAAEIVECVRNYMDGSSQNLQSLSSY